MFKLKIQLLPLLLECYLDSKRPEGCRQVTQENIYFPEDFAPGRSFAFTQLVPTTMQGAHNQLGGRSADRIKPDTSAATKKFMTKVHVQICLARGGECQCKALQVMEFRTNNVSNKHADGCDCVDCHTSTYGYRFHDLVVWIRKPSTKRKSNIASFQPSFVPDHSGPISPESLGYERLSKGSDVASTEGEWDLSPCTSVDDEEEHFTKRARKDSFVLEMETPGTSASESPEFPSPAPETASPSEDWDLHSLLGGQDDLHSPIDGQDDLRFPIDEQDDLHSLLDGQDDLHFPFNGYLE
ncbi:hypothetical protein BASA81_000996 [Batrachochytrium salamandrivorans]|nr:hypothetical protein BASA81_000996 [Batrachochytrium salamandrivorans]